jgi:Ca2+-binding RTX toxin-like protein
MFDQYGRVSDTELLNSKIKGSLFGANILFDRDCLNSSQDTSETSETNYAHSVRNLGVTSIRYPGGTIAESIFDLTTAWGDEKQLTPEMGALFFDHDQTPDTPPALTNLHDIIDYLANASLELSFVLPTSRFIGTERDAQGNRYQNVDADTVRTFVRDLLEECLTSGVRLDALELGNEWWGQSKPVISQLTAIEYGRIASRLAAIAQDEINSFRADNHLSAKWQEPSLIVQVGHGGGREWVKPDGTDPGESYKGPTVRATDLIFREFDTMRERAALDGLVTHRYLQDSFHSIDGWAYEPFDRFDQLSKSAKGFGHLDRYVTEWNVSARNSGEFGLKQASSIISLVAELAAANVTTANVWAIQQANSTRLSNNAGWSGEDWLGLSVAGHAFRMVADTIVGLRHADIDLPGHSLKLETFSGNNENVVFVSNRTGLTQVFQIDSDQLGRFSHIWGTLLGVKNNRQPLDPGSDADLTDLSQHQLVHHDRVTVTLAPYEILRLGLTYGNKAVRMSGDDEANRLIGGRGADVILGNDARDDLRGMSGKDTLFGGDGRDLLTGGIGADRLHGVDGLDVANYKQAADAVKASLQTPAGNRGEAAGDVYVQIEGLSGSRYGDTLSGDGAANLLSGNAGRDRLSGAGGDDTVVGGAGQDTFVFRDQLGTVTIADFDSATDILELSAFIDLSSFDLAAAARSSGADTVLQLGIGNQIILANFAVERVGLIDII